MAEIEQRKQRKDRDQQQLHTRIKQQLTGGGTFSKRSPGQCRQHWRAMVEQAGYHPDQYPISQYLGLHQLVYGKDQWINIMQQQAKGTALKDDVLSAQGFLALCDLLKIDSPHDAPTQLQQPYWQEAPAVLPAQAPAASVAATQAACDSPQTTLEAQTDLSAMAKAVEQQLSQLRHDQAEQEEQELREENIIGQTCDYCVGHDKKRYWSVKSYDRHVNGYKPCPVTGCNTTMDKIGMGILISHLKNQHSKKQLEALARKILRFKKDRIDPVSSGHQTTGKTQTRPLSKNSSTQLNTPKVASIELANKNSPSLTDDCVNERLTGVYHQLSKHVCLFEVNGCVCGQLFEKSWSSIRHFRTHSGEKLHECSHCAKRFYAKYDLNQHMLIHTGEKPYECSCCNKRFPNKGSLTRHKRIHSGE